MPYRAVGKLFGCGCQLSVILFLLFLFADKVEKVTVSLEEQKVRVTTSLPSDKILEALRKSGKTVTYVGVKK